MDGMSALLLLAALNHFYVTVAPATYAAIEASPFLRQHFAPFEKRTTVRNDSTYSGLYFYGRSTYFEFFAENQGDRLPGDAGLALGLEQPGASDSLRAQWSSLRPASGTPVTRQRNGRPINWFLMTSLDETRAQSAVPGLRLFSMEYAPDFLENWGAGPKGSIRMADVLAAYAHSLGLSETREKALLSDVTRVEIAGPAPGLALRARQLQLAGWKVKTAKSGRIECRGPNATVIFHPAPTPQGVRRVQFRLQRPHSAPPLTLGRSTLSFRGRTATWQF